MRRYGAKYSSAIFLYQLPRLRESTVVLATPRRGEVTRELLAQHQQVCGRGETAQAYADMAPNTVQHHFCTSCPTNTLLLYHPSPSPHCVGYER